MNIHEAGEYIQYLLNRIKELEREIKRLKKKELIE